jgi:hypothetical protein
MKDFRYDIAISLCSQDVEFARQLVKSLNPGLKVFFYETNQYELIAKSGPEKFAKVFKEESRIVVIFSRTEWSESFYTSIERDAIIHRTSVKNEGYDFLFIIPMEHGQIPVWYPPTRTYADPRRFSIQELAKFIEFKVAEEGGIIRQITTEELYQNLLDQIKAKKEIIKLQITTSAIEAGFNETKTIKDMFNTKITVFKENMFDIHSSKEFTEYTNTAQCHIGKYLLESHVGDRDNSYRRVVRAQDYIVSFKLFKNSNNKYELVEEEAFCFFYSAILKGWAKPMINKNPNQHTLPVLYSNNNNEYYDLKNPIRTEVLVDQWFQKLLKLASSEIEKHL